MRKTIIIHVAALILLSASVCFAGVNTFGDFPKVSENSILKKRSVVMLPDEERTTRPSVFKMNISQLIFRNFSFQYEYGFHKNMSAALGFNYVMHRTIPRVIFEPKSDTKGFQVPQFSGWGITPEFRFYPGKKKENQAPHGFYLAAYMRYASYQLRGDFLEERDPLPPRKYDASITYAGYTVGFMIGAQIITEGRFSVDFWIAGGGAGAASLKVKAVTSDNLSPAEQDELRKDILDNLDELGRFSSGAVKLDINATSANLTIRGLPMSSFRALGINLGFSF